MSPNRRIFLNVVATYGRSLYALAIGLFCGRWTLMLLGQTDYGLLGLVGGLTGFITFFNGIFAGSVGRFYAFYIGKEKAAENSADGIEECRRWFSLAVLIHLSIPVLLVIVGYPVGVWAVRNFLNIPPDRVEACVWVLRFVCASCFVGMANVPFQAMYTAKQEIAELTIYSFITTTANFVFLYFAIQHPGNWLVKFMLWTCCLSMAPQMVIAWRAVVKYPECRLRLRYFWDKTRFVQLFGYAAARFWTAFTDMFATQSRNILVNKFLGPKCNAAMQVGGAVSGHAMTLSNALSQAFWPALVNKAGEGDTEKVFKMAFFACRIGTAAVMLFALPLMLEAKEVLVLWLVDPPYFSSMLCVAALLVMIMERLTDGYWMVILGMGKGVKTYSLVIGWSAVPCILVLYLFFFMGMGFWSVFWGAMVWGLCRLVLRLVLGSRLVGLRFCRWLRSVFVPMCTIAAVALCAGLMPRSLMDGSFLRVVVTTCAVEAVFLPLAWRFALERDERGYVLERLKRMSPFKARFSGQCSKGVDR